MPNGTSDLFLLKHSVVIEMLDGFDGETVIGQGRELEGERGGPFRPITASTLRQVALESSGDEVRVTEQDHAYYMLHFEALWITVDEKSPLYERLVRSHEEWRQAIRKRFLDEQAWESK
jgi:hypothetical protein